MSKVLVASSILSEVDGQAYPSHIIHAFRMGRDTDDEFVLYTPRRMAIDNSRNGAVEAALKMDCDYVFFYDDDMELNAQTYKTLKERDKDIIMAMCYIRGYPFRPMVFKYVDSETDSKIADVKVKGRAISLWDNCEDHIDEDGLINDVAAVGCAATLIKTSVFKGIEKPWFYTGTANTEDVYFCMKAKSQNPDLSICVDTTVPAGHILKDRKVLYPHNAKELREQEVKWNGGNPKTDETTEA